MKYCTLSTTEKSQCRTEARSESQREDILIIGESLSFDHSVQIRLHEFLNEIYLCSAFLKPTE